MRTFKGTEGKWGVEYLRAPFNEIRKANYIISAKDAANTPICSLPKSLGNPQTKHLIDRQAADAKLIAASPEMLWEMRNAVDLMGMIKRDGLNRHYARMCAQLKRCEELLNRVLDKDE